MKFPEQLSLSVIAPCYNEEESISEFYHRTTAACRKMAGGSYEIVLVDDGSNDDTWNIISDLSLNDRAVLAVRLHRNHGHQLAVTAGLAVTRGERVMLIDADLQDPPELLADMMKIMDGGCDVVYGIRRERHGESRFKLVTASLFYRLLEKLASIPIPRNTGDFRLMSRNVVDTLTIMPERHRFIRGMVSWIGGKQVPLLYDRQSRFAGETKYPLKKMIRFASDAITGFSTIPLRMATWIGVFASFIAFLVTFFAVYKWWSNDVVPGWASSVVVTSLLSGTQLIVLGIMGEYIGRLVEEAKGRPLFMIDCIRSGSVISPISCDFSKMSRVQKMDELSKLTELVG